MAKKTQKSYAGDNPLNPRFQKAKTGNEKSATPGPYKPGAKGKKAATPKNPIAELLYATVGFASLEPNDVEKAYKYLVRKGRPRGKKIEKRAGNISKKAREITEDLRRQVTDGTEEISERLSEVVEEILSYVGIETESQGTEA